MITYCLNCKGKTNMRVYQTLLYKQTKKCYGNCNKCGAKSIRVYLRKHLNTLVYLD